MDEQIECAAPAKVNLCLSVLGPREDGYHELDSVFVPLDLADRVRVEIAPACVLEVHCPFDGEDLSGERNLAHRALTRLRQALGPKAPGFRVHIDKQVPVAAGLGGGSSDAAAALIAAQTLLPDPLPLPVLHGLAAETGADVPFFLCGGPAWVRGKGERVERLDDLPDLPLVLVVPNVPVATAEIFEALDRQRAKSLTKPAANGTRPRFFGSVARAASIVHNDLEAVTAERVPEVQSALAALRAAGALAAAMSGSGPAVFGLFESAEAARSATRKLVSNPGCVTRSVVGRGKNGENGQH